MSNGPFLSVDAKPIVSGSGSTVTFSGSYADSVTLESIAIYSHSLLIGSATLDPANQTWTLTATLGVGLYDSLTAVLIDKQDGSATTNFPYSLQFGITGQSYVTKETDFLDGAVVSETFYRSDGAVDKMDNYVAGVLASETYYHVPGAPFSSYELDYDAAGHLYSKKYYGYVSQDYVSTQYDFSYSSVTSKYSLDDIKYFYPDGSLYRYDAYNADGSRSSVFYGITGREYTSYEFDYDASSIHMSQKYFGFSGVFYSAIEQDYLWSPELGRYTWQATLYLSGDGSVLEKRVYGADGSRAITYYQITGKPYTSYEIDYGSDGKPTSASYSDGMAKTWTYNAQGVLTQIAYTGVTGAGYTSYTTKYGLDGKPTSASYSNGRSDAWSYDAQGVLTQATYTGLVGLPYASSTINYGSDGKPTSASYSNGMAQTWTYDAQGLLTKIAYTGVTGAAYTSYAISYGSDGKSASASYSNGQAQTWTYNAQGVLTQSAFTGVTGAAYTSYTIAYGSNGKPATASYSNGMAKTWTYNAQGVLTEIAFSGVTGAAYTSYSIQYGANGKPTSETWLNGATLYQTETWNPDGTYDVQNYVTGAFRGVSFSSFRNSHAASGFRDLETFYGATGDVVATETFTTDGGYTINVGGTVKQSKTVSSDQSFEIDHFGITALPYSSYQELFNSAGTLVAEARDKNDGSGKLILDANSLTVSSSGSLSVTTGAHSFALTAHANELIVATGHDSETFEYASGFGHSEIAGLLASGTSHDLIAFDRSMFSNLSAANTPSQDWAQLLSSHAAAQSGANVTITDTAQDTLTLDNVTLATLTSNAGSLFKFT